MRLTRMLSFGICVGVMLCSMSAYAATVRAICNVPAHLVMPVVQQNDPLRVFIKAGKGQWQPAEYELQDGRIIFHLQPANSPALRQAQGRPSHASCELFELVVFWTVYRGRHHLPRETDVRIPEGDDWVKLEAKRIDGSGDNCITTFKFEPIELDRIRAYQGGRAGSDNAPGYMWVTEVEAR